MEWLNYHHLYYFWTVLRAGSIRAASEELRLAPTTVGSQIHQLERTLGERLVEKKGRRLVPTDAGRTAFRYADEIFTLGRELRETIRGRPTGRPLRLVVGVTDVVPKIIAHWLVEPALRLAAPVRIVCREGSFQTLLARLAMHEFDIVLSDAPVGPGASVRAYSHLLGETGVSFVGVSGLAERRRRGFPRSLDGAPLLLPTDNTAIRRALDQWLATEGIRPDVVGEFEDYALMREFGRAGLGLFPAPQALEGQLRKRYDLSVAGRVRDLRTRFYAISRERRIAHPAVVAICEAARRQLQT